MLTIEEKIARSERFAKLCGQAEIPEWQEECEQLVAWLRELVERRKVPEIIRCKECKFYKTSLCAMSFQQECEWSEDDDYCSWAERRSDGQSKGD